MDRALDSFSRKNWQDNFFRAIVLAEWAACGHMPKLNENGNIDVEKWLSGNMQEAADE